MWADQAAGEITVREWIDRWKAVGRCPAPSTLANRAYRIRRFILPYWGKRQLNSLTGEEIAIWKAPRLLPPPREYPRSTAKDARSLLHTILGDAATARPPLIPFNPAVRPRNCARRARRWPPAARSVRGPRRWRCCWWPSGPRCWRAGTTSSPCWSRSGTRGCVYQPGARPAATGADQRRVAAQGGSQRPLRPAPAQGQLLPQRELRAARTGQTFPHSLLPRCLLCRKAHEAAMCLRRRAPADKAQLRVPRPRRRGSTGTATTRGGSSVRPATGGTRRPMGGRAG